MSLFLSAGGKPRVHQLGSSADHLSGVPPFVPNELRRFGKFVSGLKTVILAESRSVSEAAGVHGSGPCRCPSG